jgi:hypothetical protein
MDMDMFTMHFVVPIHSAFQVMGPGHLGGDGVE